MAALVVSILFIALFTGLSQGFGLSAAATETLRANQILLERIEGIRLVKWSDLNNTALVPTSFTASFYPLAGNGEAQGVTYDGAVSITDAGIGTSYNDSMRKLTVTVRWVSGKVTRTETMSTFVSRMGLQNYVYYN
jgi:hypothetical protein